jgi:RHS repeat-associated protein
VGSTTTYFYYDTDNRVIAQYTQEQNEDVQPDRIFVFGNEITEVLAMYLYEKPYSQEDVDLLFGFFDCWLTSSGGNGYNDSYDYVNDNKIDLKDWAILVNHAWNLPDLPSYETRFYYLTDALGSVRGLIGSRLNREEAREFYNYDVYGATADTSAVGNPFMFAGYSLDTESNLYYLINRMYDAYTGRMLQIDPSGYKDGMNLYEYTKSNPVKYKDPWGLDSITYWSPGGFGFPVPSQKININLDSLSARSFSPKPQFYICRRKMQCFPYISAHDYISYGESPWGGKDDTKGGWGFSSGGLTSEKYFNPDSCRGCYTSKDGTLQYGSEKGKSCSITSSSDIRSCIEKYPPRKDYSWYSYNCINYAKESAKACCLNCTSQWSKQ